MAKRFREGCRLDRIAMCSPLEGMKVAQKVFLPAGATFDRCLASAWREWGRLRRADLEKSTVEPSRSYPFRDWSYARLARRTRCRPVEQVKHHGKDRLFRRLKFPADDFSKGSATRIRISPAMTESLRRLGRTIAGAAMRSSIAAVVLRSKATRSGRHGRRQAAVVGRYHAADARVPLPLPCFE